MPPLRAKPIPALQTSDLSSVAPFLSETVAQGLARGWTGTKVVSLIALKYAIKPRDARALLMNYGYEPKVVKVCGYTKRVWGPK